MNADPAPAHADLTIVTVPHPATRQTAAFLQAILSAGNARNTCEVATSGGRPPETRKTIYLRPAIIDVLDLAIMADPNGTGGIRKACSRLAELDDHWQHLPRMSLEQVIAKPYQAARFLTNFLENPIDDHCLAEVDLRIDALRQYSANYSHPLEFLSSVDTSVENSDCLEHGLHSEVTDFVFPDTPRRIMILTGGKRSDILSQLSDGMDWLISEIPLEEGCASRLRNVVAPQGIIHLDHADGMAIGTLLDPILTHLSVRGILSGEERSETAAESVVARLTYGSSDHGLIFQISGHRWLAVPRSWRH